MKLKYIFIIPALFFFALTACTFDKAEVPAPAPAAADTCSGTPVAHTIEVANNVFIPANLTACTGDTIKWVLSQGGHTTTSTTIPAGAASWDQIMTSTGVTTFTYVVTVSGNYDYVCTFHPSMIGKLVVK